MTLKCKNSVSSGGMSDVISMKMSASWEAERSSANAVPRMCTLSLVQIILDRPIEQDSWNANFFVVIRMRGTARRVLRSPEIKLFIPKCPSSVNGVSQVNSQTANTTVTMATSTITAVPLSSSSLATTGLATTSLTNTTGVMEAATPIVASPSIGATGLYPQGFAVAVGPGAGGCSAIDFNCSIQYSHMLNRDANTLQILLQRRKKYKSKTMNLGYKTLAYCNVNLAQVLQRRIENRFLELYTDPNCTGLPVGRVEVQCLSTCPLEKDLLNGKRKVDEDEEYPIPDGYSEDSDHGDESDEDQIAENEESGRSRQKKLVKAMSMGQRQIKQKLVGLLRKLKIGDPNEEDLDPAETSKIWDELDLMTTASDMEEEDDSDADGTDSLSIRSIPKPVLRPFFAATGGSDETLSADAGTKLLRRLQRQLFTQPETATDTVEVAEPRTSFPTTQDSKRESLGPTGLTAIPPVATTTTPGGYPLATDSRATIPNTSGRRHSRGGVGRLSGGRLTKRLAHMGRRSNLNSKSASNTGVGGSDVTGKSTDVSTERYPPPGDSSDDESAHIPGYRNNTECVIAPLSGDSLLPAESLPTTTSPHWTSTTGGHAARTEDPSSTLHWKTRTLETGAGLNTSTFMLEQLQPDCMDKLANFFFLVHLLEPGGKLAGELFSKHSPNVHTVTSFAETRQAFSRLVTEAQHQPRRPDLIRVCILGGDALVNFVLRAYVDQLSSRSAELAAVFRFYVIPVTGLVRGSIRPVTEGLGSRHGTAVGVAGLKPRPLSEVTSGLDPSIEVESSGNVISGPWSTGHNSNNLLACHLCKIDPIYAGLFFDWCYDDFRQHSHRHSLTGRLATGTTTNSSVSGGGLGLGSGTMTTNTINNSSGTAAVNTDFDRHREWTLLDRALIYLTHSRTRVLTMPIGACLLGTATSMGSGVPTKPHKSMGSFAASGEQSSTVTPSTGDTVAPFSQSPDSPVATMPKSIPSASNEDTLMPFLLTVRLGTDLSGAHFHTRSTCADPNQQTQSDLGAGVFSDPEASGGQPPTVSTKSGSGTDATGSVISPRSSFRRSRFHRSHSTTHSTTSPADARLWDIQMEYWLLPAAVPSNQMGGAVSSSTNSPASANTLNSGSSGQLATSADTVPPRRVTMKSTCRGLVVYHGLQTAGHWPRGSDSEVTGGSQFRLSPQPQLLNLAVWMKEKKQKIMRIGRKGKECGGKFELIEGIQRLLCTGRGSLGGGGSTSGGGGGSASVERNREVDTFASMTSSTLPDVGGLALESSYKHPNSIGALSLSSGAGGHHMMRVAIDGVEWAGLKFFQVTPTWRTHIKAFPIISLSVGRMDTVATNEAPSPTIATGSSLLESSDPGDEMYDPVLIRDWPLPLYPYVNMLGVPTRGGQPKDGTQLGPNLIRQSDIVESLRGIGVNLHDHGDVTIPEQPDTFNNKVYGMLNLHNFLDATNAIAQRVEQILRSPTPHTTRGRTVPINMSSPILMIGGDHSMATGSIMGHKRVKPDACVIWVDAHADLNTPMTSSSGNMHGMPVSFLMHELQDEVPYMKELDSIQPCLRSVDIAYIGLRDLDPHEVYDLCRNSIAHFSMLDIDKMGIDAVIQSAIKAVNPRLERPIHLSFDIDVMDPSLAPSTGTPVPGGLTMREGLRICEELYATGKLSVVDMVELNPLLGGPGDAATTCDTAVRLLKACLGHRRHGHLPFRVKRLAEEGIQSRADYWKGLH